MNLIDMEVNHKSFGLGKIIKQDGNYLVVKFGDEEKTFTYPDSFERFLSIDNKEVYSKIKKDIEKKKIIKKNELEKSRKEEEEKRKLRIIKSFDNDRKSKREKTNRENVAFKCNYCDGGKSDREVGFNGVCSDEIIKNNILVENRVWCSSEECECSSYLKGDITRRELDYIHSSGGYVCYESQMLRDWKAMAGIVHSGSRAGQPMRLNKVKNNSLCILTTRLPNSKEIDRFIFGVFLVDDSYQGDNYEEGFVSTKSKYRIKLSPKEAEKMLFWNYYSNKSQPEIARWGSGLHRYFKDEQAVQILKDIAILKRGTADEKLAEEFLNYFSKIHGVDIDSLPEKNGALMRDR